MIYDAVWIRWIIKIFATENVVSADVPLRLLQAKIAAIFRFFLFKLLTLHMMEEAGKPVIAQVRRFKSVQLGLSTHMSALSHNIWFSSSVRLEMSYKYCLTISARWTQAAASWESKQPFPANWKLRRCCKFLNKDRFLYSLACCARWCKIKALPF